jgi:hypothetical protein
MKKGIKSEQKVFTSQEEACQRSKRRIIESQSSSASEKTGFGPSKITIFEEILGKKGLALWYKGHQSIIKLCLTLLGSVGTLLTWAGGRQAQKTHKNVQKNPKFQSNFDNQAECDGVKSQSANAIRYEGVNKA